MFLEEIVRKEPHAELGRHAEAMQMMQASGMPVPGLYHLLNFRPRAGRHVSNWMQEVMRGPGALSPEVRERIAAWTSSRNGCPFCTQVHTTLAAHLAQDAATVEAVCRNPQTAPISEREKALFRFLAKVNDLPSAVTREDFDAARAAGLTEDELFEASTVCAALNFFNRWISAAGVSTLPEGFWEGFFAVQGDLTYRADFDDGAEARLGVVERARPAAEAAAL